MTSEIKAGNATNGVQITSDSTGILEIKTGTGAGTTAMVLDASQNVGIGTSSPDSFANFVFVEAGSNVTKQGVFQATDGTTKVAMYSTSGLGIVSTRTAHPLALFTNGSERARIDTNGNVGIGTTSPSFKLDVAGNARVGNVYGTGLTITVAGNSITYPTDNTLAFNTNSSERARIDSSGNLLVNTTSQQSGGTLSVVATALNNAATFRCADNGANVVRSWMATTSGTRFHIAFGDGSSFTERGVISTNGSTTTYGTGSDYRLKENVQTMSGALARVAQMRPVTWTWKESQVSGEGFIAHELQAVVPDAVVGEKDAVDENGKPIYQNVDASFVVATLTAAIQELNAKVEAQAAEIAALKGA
jgi:hypothetical protein